MTSLPYDPRKMIGRFSLGRSGDSNIIVELTGKPSIDEIKRAENVQLIVAVALISAYFTTATGDGSPFIDAEPHLQILAGVSFLFLAMKLVTLTIRPFTKFEYLDAIDVLLLPFVFVFMVFLGGLVLLSSILKISMSIIIPLTVDFKTVAVITIIAILGLIYTKWVKSAMGNFGSSIPVHRLTVRSGSGSSLPLTLSNNSKDAMAPGEVKFVIDSPDLVHVEIEPARRLEEDLWETIVPIGPNSTTQVDVEFQRSEEKEGLTDEDVKVSIRRGDETLESHLIKLTI